MKDPTIYDVPTPAEVEEMERLPAICTCRGNNDCDGSCQCPPPSETQAETSLANLVGELELRDNIEKQLRLRIEHLESVVSTKPTGCEPCSWPECGCQNSPKHLPGLPQALPVRKRPCGDADVCVCEIVGRTTCIHQEAPVRGPDCACCEQQPRRDCAVPGCSMKDAEWALPARHTGSLQCLRCGTVDAFGPASKRETK